MLRARISDLGSSQRSFWDCVWEFWTLLLTPVITLQSVAAQSPLLRQSPSFLLCNIFNGCPSTGAEIETLLQHPIIPLACPVSITTLMIHLSGCRAAGAARRRKAACKLPAPACAARAADHYGVCPHGHPAPAVHCRPCPGEHGALHAQRFLTSLRCCAFWICANKCQ